MTLITTVLSQLINLLVLLIIIRALLSWFMQLGRDPLTRLLLDITDPILTPIRNLTSRIVPGIPIDFSPIIAIMALQFLAGLVLKAGRGY